MNYIADTMAIVLLIEGRHLTTPVQNIFFEALTGKHTIHIPAIVLIEIGYLNEKKRITASINDVEGLPAENFRISSIDSDVISATFKINDIPELHDRLIAGTAKYLDLPIITNDPVIANSKFGNTIWK